MGCDIHMHVECKHGENWKLHNREIYDGRNYELFGILAGVRGSSTPISVPKGFPEDVSNEVMEDRVCFGEYGHSDSWLTFDEIYNSRFDYDNHSLKQIALDMLSAKRVQQAEDVRIVFWFDN